MLEKQPCNVCPGTETVVVLSLTNFSGTSKMRKGLRWEKVSHMSIGCGLDP